MGKKAVFTFGRCNPFTKGHEELFKFVMDYARKNGAEGRIYLAKTENHGKNPLPYRQKVAFGKQLFPWANIIDDPQAINAFSVCRKLSDEGYTDAIS